VGTSGELRAVFDSACAACVDTGSGWDPPAAGQMSFFAFTEALLVLSQRALDDAPGDEEETPSVRRPSAQAVDSPVGLASGLQRILQRIVQATSSS